GARVLVGGDLLDGGAQLLEQRPVEGVEAVGRVQRDLAERNIGFECDEGQVDHPTIAFMTERSLPVVGGVDHRWIDVDGVSLHVAEAGVSHRSASRPSLVLVHGWPQHWFCWRHVMPALAETYHVVAIDLRGAGWSDVPAGVEAYDKRVIADEVARALEVLELDRPVLVGHDWGAWTSLLVASRHPGAVRGVVAAAIVAPWESIPWHHMWRFAYQPIAGGVGGAFLQRRAGQVLLK